MYHINLLTVVSATADLHTEVGQSVGVSVYKACKVKIVVLDCRASVHFVKE